MEQDVYRIGLNGTIDADKRARDRRPGAGGARVGAQDAWPRPISATWSSCSTPTASTARASVAENLLFGTPVGPVFAYRRAGRERAMCWRCWSETGLIEEFIEVGAQIAETMVELFADLPPGHEFFEQFSFIGAEDLPEFQPIVMRGEEGGRGSAAAGRPHPPAVAAVQAGAVPPPPGRVRRPTCKQRLLEARKAFAAELPEDLRQHIEFFDAERFNEAASLQDNILFGKIRYGRPDAAERVQTLIQTWSTRSICATA